MRPQAINFKLSKLELESWTESEKLAGFCLVDRLVEVLSDEDFNSFAALAKSRQLCFWPDEQSE